MSARGVLLRVMTPASQSWIERRWTPIREASAAASAGFARGGGGVARGRVLRELSRPLVAMARVNSQAAVYQPLRRPVIIDTISLCWSDGCA